MARFNTAVRTGVRSPIITTTSATTALGGQGFERDAKSELFLLAVSNMANPGGAFHESGTDRDARYTALIAQCAPDTAWFTGFLGFLRNTANMRSASIIAAADGVRARLTAGVVGGNREMIARVLQRADEPGELLAYWTATHGRNIPSCVKRGISDALSRLYSERSFLKWDSESRGFRFADVIQLAHPKADGWRNDLYKYVLNQRYQDAAEIPETLATIRARAALMAVPVTERRTVTAGQLAEAGMTWESLAGWLQGPMDAAAWESAIPSMGYMALLRNLRNFDQAGIGKAARREVEDRLTDPEQVAKSRQLPMRFLSAYRATRDSGTVTAWGPVIEEALNLSLANVPTLAGRTLVLVDLSGSMSHSNLSDKSGLRYVDAAAVFGAAIAKRNDADLYGFDHRLIEFTVKSTDSLLPLAHGIANQGGGGTATAAAIQASYKGHDRIIIVTDEQYQNWGYGSVSGSVDQILDQFDVPAYTWNLAGYKVAQGRSGSRKRHTFGGLSDAAFKMIPLIESVEHQAWPWS
jgi:hypothetical protein